MNLKSDDLGENMDRMITKELLSQRLLPRENDTHKGDYGHALLVCGCDRMPGAASLATGAALKSGCGLVTLHSSSSACRISSVMNPSAILSIDEGPCFCGSEFNWNKYNAVGVGPGLGKDPKSKIALEKLMESCSAAGIPMVLDADALNLIAENGWIHRIPQDCILTPHDGELSRLISNLGKEDKLRQTQLLADKTRSVVIAKGYHTKVFIPDEQSPYENTTGNPGMAKGGSGDVLSGIILSMLGQGVEPFDAACCGAYIHRRAGDRCANEMGEFGMTPTDMLNAIPYILKPLNSREW